MITPDQLSNPDVEASEQKALMAWAAIARKDYPQLKWLHAIPNANQHRLIAEGVRGGVPDVCLPYPVWHNPTEIYKKFYSGLYIEMKIEKRRKQKNGGCSDDQLEWYEYLISVGYQCYVCYGWQEARDRILEYLNG
jgi:hypothetical protein